MSPGEGFSDAMQVADRWHLMEKASRAFLAAMRSCMRQIRAGLGTTNVDADLLTAAEKRLGSPD